MSAHSLLTPLLLTHLCLLGQLNLSNNRLCGVWTEDDNQHGNCNAEGINAIADALRVNGALTSIDFSGNTLCGLDWEGKGIYTTEGITSIADVLRVNGALTQVLAFWPPQDCLFCSSDPCLCFECCFSWTSQTTNCAASMNMAMELTLQRASQRLPTLCASIAC